MHSEFAYFYSVVLIDLELKRSDAFILSGSSLENHTRFQTKMHGQSLFPFSDQKGSKSIPFGAAHTPMTCIRV